MLNHMHYILSYQVVEDYVARRGAFRKAHLELVRNAFAQGDLVLAGALDDPPDGAVLVFRGSEAAAQAFAISDPYVSNGLVTSWKVRKWNTVVGDGAEMPEL